MANLNLATELVASLPTGYPGLFNPWRDECPGDTEHNGPQERLCRLAQHLSCAPEFLVVGEASGYLGMRRSAIAFTSERLLLSGSVPRVSVPPGRLTTRRLPYSEPSATIVWRSLKAAGIEEHTVLWNALPMHPYKADNFESNRTPTDEELQLGVDALRILASSFPRAKLVAVGRKAEHLIGTMGLTVHAQIRHPANGGANAFLQGLLGLQATRTRNER